MARACPVNKINSTHYPTGLIAAANHAPPGPWLYTGALENRPDIVSKINRPLWGNPPDVLRRVRSPLLLAEALRRHGLACPHVAVARAQVDPALRYVVKPLRSAAGAHLRMFDSQAAFIPGRSYLQEWTAGDPCSATFVGDALGSAQLLGVTRQLIGEPWLAAAPFQWCGNIGPLALDTRTSATLERVGQALVNEFTLRGLFGVDFILRDGVPWPVEVNPRYPASLEVLERATGQSFLTAHAEAFGAAATDAKERRPQGKVVAKAILFARQPLVVAGTMPWDAALEMPFDDLTLPFADIPAAGTRIQIGQPICSLFASAGDINCLTKLRTAVAELERRLQTEGK